MVQWYTLDMGTLVRRSFLELPGKNNHHRAEHNTLLHSDQRLRHLHRHRLVDYKDLLQLRNRTLNQTPLFLVSEALPRLCQFKTLFHLRMLKVGILPKLSLLGRNTSMLGLYISDS